MLQVLQSVFLLGDEKLGSRKIKGILNSYVRALWELSASHPRGAEACGVFTLVLKHVELIFSEEALFDSFLLK